MSLVELANRNDINVFVYATGAGSGIQKQIWNTVGCSSFFVGAAFPYASKLSAKALGYKPEQFVSAEMSIDFAMSAYIQAFEFGKKCIGIGLTASVASNRMHRGDHRIFVSAFSEEGCFTTYAVLAKGVGAEARSVDGSISDDLAIAAILHAAGYNNVLSKDDNIHHFDSNSPALQSIYSKPYFNKLGQRLLLSELNTDNIVFYPGNFNPIHEGHLGASQAVLNTIASRFGKRKDVVFTTTMDPPHKKALSAAEVLQRAAALQGHDFLVTTNDARYIDKARAYPGASFIIGADALIRMLDPKWGIATQDLLDEFTKLNTTFFVLGRLIDGRFLTLHDIEDQFPILYKYQKTFEPVAGRWDISSTEIRNKLA
jgi:nicotinic acid mononucleotide adenylyltransferase